MSYDERNVFARILAGELPCERVYEDEHVLAFRDVNPRAPVHVVVIPKGRYTSILEFTAEASPEQQAGFLRALGEVPRKLGLDETGFRLLVNTGDDGRPGFQHEVPHFHVHVLGGRPLGPLLTALELRDGRVSAPQVVEDDVSLILLPVAEEASDEQVEVLSRELELESYEVQRLFPCPLPRALRGGGRSEVEALRLRLEGTGLPLRMLESSALLADFDPWRVDRIKLDGEQLVLLNAEGEERIAPDDRGLVVRGRYTWTVSGHETGRMAPFTSDINRRRGSSTRIAKPKRVQFAHLYLERLARPFSFVEDRIGDYSFLGEEMTASAHTNFDKLVELVARAEGIGLDDSLLKSAMMVKVVGKSVWEGTEKPSSTSPDTEADVLSRLTYLLARPEGAGTA